MNYWSYVLISWIKGTYKCNNIIVFSGCFLANTSETFWVTLGSEVIFSFLRRMAWVFSSLTIVQIRRAKLNGIAVSCDEGDAN